jgi:hypothetical protein
LGRGKIEGERWRNGRRDGIRKTSFATGAPSTWF